MIIKNHYLIFFFYIIFFLIYKNSALSVDDSDILIDRVLMTAVKKSNYQKVEEMLDKDAAVNYRDSKNLVPLAYALENDDSKMFKLLLSKGANPKATILKKTSLLIYYISINKYSMIDEIIQSGVDINFQDKMGMTALMHSVEKLNVNAVTKLVQKESNLDITDFSGKTIFDYSKNSRNIVIKKIFEDLENSY